MSRTIQLELLDRIRIASPCPMRWEQMTPVGSAGHTRHCGQCNLDVYNLSNMTFAETESLLGSRPRDQRLCAGFFRRPDGTILSRDCPVGLRAARLKLTRALTRLAAAVAFALTGAILARPQRTAVTLPGLRRVQPFATLCDWVKPGSALIGPPPASGPATWDGGLIDLQAVLRNAPPNFADGQPGASP